MSDLSSELERLRDELKANDDEFAAFYTRQSTWAISLGPLAIRRAIGSQLIALIYVVFNSACFIVGLILAPMNGALDTIGVSLIVGALFSFGAYVAQFWAVQAQREIDTEMRVNGEAELRGLKEKRDKISRRLEQLEEGNRSESAEQN